jgi:type IV secretory pathway VirB10-like protein
MKLILLAVLVAAAACGGSSPPPAAPATEPTPATEPVAPAEPAPVEPAAPPEPVAPAPPPPPPAPDPAQIKAELRATELAAFESAKPVFDKWCAKCHSKTGKATSAKKREEFDMTSYPFGGEHAKEIGEEVLEVLGLTGKKPSMPADKKGAVKGAELELMKAWAEAFEASRKGGAHES